MKVTNIHSIDESIFNLLSKVYPPIPNRFSITDLCNPPLMRKLREDHWDELEEDVSDKLWMLLGSAIHAYIEKGAPKDGLAEEKLTITDGSATIVGKVDLWHNGIIKDYKCTSVWSFLLGAKKEWEKQLNLYKWLYTCNGFATNKLEIHAILRDWQQSKIFEKDYPKIPFIKQDILMWAWDYAIDVVNGWFVDYKYQPIICTDEERWAKPITWAVKEYTKKKAKRVFDNKEWAEKWACGDDSLYIEERPGEYTRCKNYCQVRKVCPYNPYKEGE